MEALKFTVVHNGSEIQTLDFDGSKSSIIVGRAAESDIRLDNRAVGRNHAVIQLAAGGFTVKKQTEFGKLQLNGADVSEAPVKAGDVIAIADYQLRVEARQAAVAAPDAVTPVPAYSPSALEAHPPANIGPDQKTPPQGTVIPDREAGLVEAEGDDSQGAALMDTAAAESESTAMISANEITVKLVFKPGEANLEELPINKAEVSVGRGSGCDVVIEDKKASRKHCIIRRVGSSFQLKDLGSANGTYVNGIKVSEQELAGEDVIKIGSTEFSFKAMNQDYFTQESQGAFLQAREELAPAAPALAEMPALEAPAPDLALAPMAMDGAPQPAANPMSAEAMAQYLPQGAGAGQAAAMGMSPGALPGSEQPPAASQAKGLKGLWERYKAMPKAQRLRLIMIAAVVFGGYAMMQDQADEAANANKKKAEQAAVDPKQKEFSKLPREKREFIEQSYTLCYDYYTKGKFDEAKFEAEKILEILPNGYKDITQIRDLAMQGIETLKAQAEEADRKKKEQERKENIMKLVTQAQEYFNKGMEAEAKEVFSRILELDPDNPTVARLKASIEEKENRRRLEEEQKRQVTMMRDAMTSFIAAAEELRARGMYYAAIEKLTEVAGAGSDTELLEKAKDLIGEIDKEIADKRQPFIDAGNSAYDAKNYEGAREQYHKALEIDPRCQECNDGIARVRKDVHERAQKIYIEAILAESVGDLTLARKKYVECFKSSVPEDDYYGRCWRKYHRFSTLEGDTLEGEQGLRAPAEALREDPYTKEAMDFL